MEHLLLTLGISDFFIYISVHHLSHISLNTHQEDNCDTLEYNLVHCHNLGFGAVLLNSLKSDNLIEVMTTFFKSQQQSQQQLCQKNIQFMFSLNAENLLGSSVLVG